LAIFVALYSRSVLLSLFGGILLGLFILNDFSFYETFLSLFSLFISLLSEAWILKTVAFAILVGSVMSLLEKSGGIEGFVYYMQEKKNLITSQREVLLVPFFIGIFIFIESSITSLIAGAVGKPLCDANGVSHAKLAFVCDSTAAPISSLIVLNGWGALLLGLISTQIETGVISGDSVTFLINAVLYNFYAMSAVLVTFLTIWFHIDLGAMKYAKVEKPNSTSVIYTNKKSMNLMLLPIFIMIFSVFVFLYITGDGSILKGSGSSSIFYTMLTTLFFMFVYYLLWGTMTLKVYTTSALSGARKLFPIALILLFAFGIGRVTTEMQTGYYLASLASDNLHVYFLAGTVFLLSSLISFSTGTSWGTFSIMIPIAVPMAVGMDANISLAIGAVISGGVFGDHCSPISDTTIISSMAADCEVVEHVRTQLPYALISGVIAFILFFLFSLNT
jgi:Na+/H+ antiporter NhaC